MFNKKILFLFLLILYSITVVSAEDISFNNLKNEFIGDYSLSMNQNQSANITDDLSYDVDKNNKNSGTKSISKSKFKSKNSKKTLVKSNLKKSKGLKVWISHVSVTSKVSVITLKSSKKGVIYYTTDGSKPTIKSKKYTKPIKISYKKVLKYFIVDANGSSSKMSMYKRFLGKNSNGYVEKLYYGNLSSSKTIALVVGVHVQESGMHKAIKHSLENKNSLLNRKFVLYYVHVTKNKNNYEKSRMNGQVLAKKFVVTDISSEKPSIFTDVHETRYKISGYKYPRFIHIISTNARPGVKVSKKLYKKSVVYLNRLLKLAPHLKRYDPPPTGSSPPYVTIPIANKGIVSYVYETEASYVTKTKQNQANKYILALNDINLNFK